MPGITAGAAKVGPVATAAVTASAPVVDVGVADGGPCLAGERLANAPCAPA